MTDENAKDLIALFVAAKVAIAQEGSIPETKLETAKEKHAIAWEKLMAAGFSDKVIVRGAVAVSPRDFLVVLSSGPLDTLIMFKTANNESVEIPCQKALDIYDKDFL
ncbi:hypothetical protein D3X12_24150 [Pseudomonas protegens]|jgi:hypothetical protein|uniref:Uncharacterized protein n=1 Tax=Pseudomonas protegens TaxID=380021 RepID=A0ABY2VNZ8_9PSED|nr:hypothetical protein [Pseudomonas protegens]ASE22789.1 hypothetical protein CEP86_20780 [Pseudomonas protegens]QEZ53523.1 hypothetical protein D3X12_24150 [Pseudomonas protegens]QEZ60269.1 hypothetical protein D4N38_27660 [Pseudomonas protegens]QEZ64814.1 hypothetical protein D4N37_19480 [Pseudomonas protegens]QIC31301.1 hypothetical protein FQ342_23615 [Pseudomonas protegens]